MRKRMTIVIQLRQETFIRNWNQLQKHFSIWTSSKCSYNLLGKYEHKHRKARRKEIDQKYHDTPIRVSVAYFIRTWSLVRGWYHDAEKNCVQWSWIRATRWNSVHSLSTNDHTIRHLCGESIKLLLAHRSFLFSFFSIAYVLFNYCAIYICTVPMPTFLYTVRVR